MGIQRLTSNTLANKFDVGCLIQDIIMGRGLQWLEHLECMNNETLLRSILFGELRKNMASLAPKNITGGAINYHAGNMNS